MAEPHHYLKDKHSTEETLIILSWRAPNYRFVYSTGEQVRPGLWSDKKKKVLTRHPNADAINSKLERLKIGVVDEYERILKEKGVVSKADLKKALNVITGKERGGASLFEFLEDFIDQKRATRQMKVSSLKSYTSAKNILHRFAKSQGLKEIDFTDIDYQSWYELEGFMIDRGYSANYINKILSRLKTVLKEAIKLGITKHINLDHLESNSKAESTTAIYLNTEELQKLYEIDYSGNKRLEKTRDLFLVGAVTGLRYSDFSRISQDDIREVEGIDMLFWATQKTGNEVVIPVHRMLKELLKKHKGTPPYVTQQKMNKHLKEIGKECGFMDDRINKTITKGGQRVSTMTSRHELFTTHTARRSFATNSYLSGLDTIKIMMMTGHESEREFLKYIRVTKEENALIIARANQDRKDSELSKALDSLRWWVASGLLTDEEKGFFQGVLGRVGL